MHDLNWCPDIPLTKMFPFLCSIVYCQAVNLLVLDWFGILQCLLLFFFNFLKKLYLLRVCWSNIIVYSVWNQCGTHFSLT